MENETKDEDIARMVQNGEMERFGILVERYEAKIMRYGRKFLSDSDDIKDMLQNVFIKAYTNIQGFNAEKKFSSWIYRIAHNEFVNALKKKHRDPFPFSFFDFDVDVLFPHLRMKDTPESDFEEKETKITLEKHLREIDPKYREPLTLYYFEEMDYKDISEILRIPVSTVGVRLKRGKEILKKIYKKHE